MPKVTQPGGRRAGNQTGCEHCILSPTSTSGLFLMSPAKASSLRTTDAISKGRDPPCKSVAQSPSSKVSSQSSLYFIPTPSKFPLLLTEEGCGKYSLRDHRGWKFCWSLMGGACKSLEAGAFPLRTSISSPVKWDNSAQLKGGRPWKRVAEGEGSISTRMMCPGAHSPVAPLPRLSIPS